MFLILSRLPFLSLVLTLSHVITLHHLMLPTLVSEVKVAQSSPILCDPMDYTVHGILQARILEWVAFPFPGDLPNPGIKPRSPALQVDSLPAEPPGKPFYLYKLPRMGKLVKTAS